MRVGLRKGVLKAEDLQGFTMYLTAFGEDYGRIACWKCQNGAMNDSLIDGSGMPPGKGLLILERQLGILRFLIKCCQLTMHDVQMDLR